MIAGVLCASTSRNVTQQAVRSEQLVNVPSSCALCVALHRCVTGILPRSEVCGIEGAKDRPKQASASGMRMLLLRAMCNTR